MFWLDGYKYFILKTIQLCENKTINVRKQYLEPFNCVKIKLLVLESNTWKHLKEWKQNN